MRPRIRRRPRALRSGWVILSLVLGAAHCTERMSVDEHRVRAVVRSYNLALQEAYAEKRPELLAETATPDEQSRVATLIFGLSQQGKVLESRQETLEVRSVELLGSDKAELTAQEIWWYRHYDREATKVVQEPKRAQYSIRYLLVKEGDRWLVDRLENLESADLPSASGP